MENWRYWWGGGQIEKEKVGRGKNEEKQIGLEWARDGGAARGEVKGTGG